MIDRRRVFLGVLAIALGGVVAGCGATTTSPLPGNSSRTSASTGNADAFMRSQTPAGGSFRLGAGEPMRIPAADRVPAMLRAPQSQIAGLGWTQLSGSAQYAAASPDGSLWVISNARGGGADNAIFHYVNGTWSFANGVAVRVAIAPNGTAYAVNAGGNVYVTSGTSWSLVGCCASDVSAASDGSLYAVASGTNALYHYAAGVLSQLPGAGVRITASWDAGNYPGNLNAGGYWVVNASNAIYYFSPGVGYVQIGGAANEVAPTNQGGLFALGADANNDHAIYYYDLNAGSWTTQGGSGTSITAAAGNVYATNSAGGIYQSAISSPPAPLPFALNLTNLGAFYGETVATFSHNSPRGMAMLPNGDLLVGTGGGTAAFAQSGQIYIIPNAETRAPAAPTVFATLTDGGCSSSAGTNTNGIAFAPSSVGGTIFVGMECSVWKIPYVTGDRTASSTPAQFLRVRTGAPPLNSDGDVHHTTSLAVAGSTLYVSVGSSCNACTETDGTRAAIFSTSTSSPSLTLVATRVRNALALAINPATNTLWAGGAGQDCVTGATCFAAQDATYALNAHPYEWLDPVTKHAAPVDYQWPWCEENGKTVTAPDPKAGTMPAGTNCASMVVPAVRAPAYSTIMGATFYAPAAGATYAFPGSFQGGLFFTMHGSWHEDLNGVPVAVPQIAFVPMNMDAPVHPMDWTVGSPYATWERNTSGNPAPFMNGFQQGNTRYGRPAGIVVGPSGSLFISDDTAGMIYRIRPGSTPPASVTHAPAAAAKNSLR